MDIAQLGFQIDSRQAVSAARNLDGMSASAGRAQTATERMAQQVVRSLRQIDNVIKTAATALGGFFVISQATQFAVSLGRVADQYANIQAKIRLATTGQEQFVRASAEVFAISQRTFSSFDSTATLVARTTRALQSNGASAEEALQKSLALSETIQQAFAVSGATTQEATNAIIQLSQGLAAGALRGEEFNSIAEQGPRIMQALAASLGVTTGELRAMAMEGKLTAEIVTNALTTQAGVINAEFSQLPLTIQRSIVVFSNEWQKFIGELDQASGASRSVAEAIATIGRNLGPITDALIAVSAAALAAFGGRVLQSLGAYAGEVVKAVAAKSAMLEMERMSAAASLQAAQARSVEIARTLEVVGLARQEIVAKQALARADLDAAQRTLAATQNMMALSSTLRARRDATEAVIVAQQRLNAVTNELAVLGRAQVGVQNQLAVAASAQVAAAQRAGAALTGWQAAMTSLSAAGAKVASGLGSLFAAVGGWATVAIAAAYALYQLGDAMISGTDEAQANALALDRMTESMEQARVRAALLARGVSEAAVEQTTAIRAAVQSLEELQGKTYATEQVLVTLGASLGGVASAAAQGFALVTEQIDSASIDEQTEALNRYLTELGNTVAVSDNAAQAIDEAVTSLEAAGINTDGLRERLTWLNETFGQTTAAASSAAEGIKPFSEETQKLIDRIRTQTETLGLSGASLIEYQKGQALASAAARKATADETIAIAARYDALIQGTAAQEAAAEAERLASEARAASLRVEQEAAQAKAQAAQETDDFVRSLEDLQAALSGPLATAELQHARNLDEIRSKLSRGIITKGQARSAEIAYGEQLRRTTAELRAQASPQDQLIEALEFEVALMRAGRAERERMIALRQLGAEATEEERKAVKDLIAELERMAEIDSLTSRYDGSGVRDLMGDLERMKELLRQVGDETSKAFDPERAQGLRVAIGNARQEMLVGMVGAAQQVLQSVQGMSKEGSKAYKAMEVASHALNVVMAIGAILNQGKGDPYTAFGRMAAMAVAVAGLVGSIGANFGGSTGFTDTAEERQRTQGTGTVLGDAEAKSASIQNALDITADATSQLVGINRGMLTALQALQGGIDRAGGMLARGAGQAEFSGVPGRFDVGGAFMGGLFGSLATRVLDPLGILGGSSRVTDQGLAIGGGSLSDIGVQAFQEQQYRRWRFGSRRTREDFQPVGEAFESQFQLIVDSIVNTVREGALALGMLPAEVEAALAAFRLEEIRISLKDLSAEEQQAELLAVFSQIFDNLAGSVVPYIEQFQRVGEGLGETLVRVATSVQVTQEAVTRLGFSMGQLDPERFAQASVALVELVGGIDEFVQAMGSFVDKFAPEAHRFEVLQNDLTRAFTEAGLVLPETRDGMWQLMQSLDATTEAGRAQIATLLRLADSADAYYRLIERREEERLRTFDEEAAADYAALVGRINDELRELGGESEFQQSLRGIAVEYNSNVARLNELARAAGLAGAREEDLARALQLSTMQRMRAIMALEAEGRALVESLGLGEMGQIDAEIAALQASESAAVSAIQSFGGAMAEVANDAADAVNLLLGDLSPLLDSQKLDIALEALRAGQIGPEEVLRIGRRLRASGADYRQLFDEVMAIGDRRNQGGDFGGGGPSGPATPEVSPAMQALLDRRAEIEAQQRSAQRFSEATELAQIIADIAGARGEDFETIARSLGLTGLDQILGDLRIKDLEGLNTYLETLQANTYSIDDLAELVTAGEQLIVDTLKGIFGPDPSRFGPQLAKDAVIEEIPAKIEASSEPVQEELRLLRDQVRALTDAMQQVVANTGNTATATESLAETVASRELVQTSISSRSNRIGEAFTL